MSAPYRTILVTGSSAVLGTALRAIAPERPGHGLAFRPEVLKDHVLKG